MARVDGEAFVLRVGAGGPDGWSAARARSLDAAAYAALLNDSVLAPCPSGNAHPETYRVYEALECGALPIVDTDYYFAQFGAPFPMAIGYREAHGDAFTADVNALLGSAAALARHAADAVAWWAREKARAPAAVAALVAEARALTRELAIEARGVARRVIVRRDARDDELAEVAAAIVEGYGVDEECAAAGEPCVALVAELRRSLGAEAELVASMRSLLDAEVGSS